VTRNRSPRRSIHPWWNAGDQIRESWEPSLPGLAPCRSSRPRSDLRGSSMARSCLRNELKQVAGGLRKTSTSNSPARSGLQTFTGVVFPGSPLRSTGGFGATSSRAAPFVPAANRHLSPTGPPCRRHRSTGLEALPVTRAASARAAGLRHDLSPLSCASCGRDPRRSGCVHRGGQGSGRGSARPD